MTDERARRDAMSYHDQMADAQALCVPCKLCGGNAVISDAGTGAGYHIRCGGTVSFHRSKGCLIGDNRLGGWAYNVMEWWNRLHTPAPSIVTGSDERAREVIKLIVLDAIHQYDNRDGWTAQDLAADATESILSVLAASSPTANGTRHQCGCEADPVDGLDYVCDSHLREGGTPLDAASRPTDAGAVDWDRIRRAVAKAAWPTAGLVDNALEEIRAALGSSDRHGSPECPSSSDGRHQVDTSMEEGPNNCFHCSATMGTHHAR